MKVSITIETWQHKDGTAYTVSVNGSNLGTHAQVKNDSEAIKQGVEKAIQHVLGGNDDTDN